MRTNFADATRRFRFENNSNKERERERGGGEREREIKKRREREKEGNREKWNWMELHVCLDRACIRTLKRAEKSARDCFPWSRGDRFIE